MKYPISNSYQNDTGYNIDEFFRSFEYFKARKVESDAHGPTWKGTGKRNVRSQDQGERSRDYPRAIERTEWSTFLLRYPQNETIV